MIKYNTIDSFFKLESLHPKKYFSIFCINNKQITNNLLGIVTDISSYKNISGKNNYNISNKLYVIPNIGLVYRYMLKKFTKEIAIKIFNNYFEINSFYHLIQTNYISSINKRLKYYTSVVLSNINNEYTISFNTNTNSCSLQLSIEGHLFKIYLDDITNLLLSKFSENLKLSNKTKKIINMLKRKLNDNYTLLNRKNII